MEKKKKSLSMVIMTILILAIVAIVTLAILYYLFFDVSKDAGPNNESRSFSVTAERTRILLDHIGIIDPFIKLDGLVLASDLSEDTRLAIVIEDLLDTENYVSSTENGVEKYLVSFNDVLSRSLKIYDLKTYDYYPDKVEFKNYVFEKSGNNYIGSKTVSDEEYGYYVYEMKDPLFSVTASFELQLTDIVFYYKDINGVYENSTRENVLCEGKDCETKSDINIPKRELHATYQIKDNEFVITSISYSRL